MVLGQRIAQAFLRRRRRKKLLSLRNGVSRLWLNKSVGCQRGHARNLRHVGCCYQRNAGAIRVAHQHNRLLVTVYAQRSQQRWQHNVGLVV